MSALKRLVVVLALVGVCAGASAEVLYFEDFESFNTGLVLHEESGWEGWYGDAGAAATVTDDVAFSGTKAVEIDGGADAVRVFDITEGKWVLTAMQYIPSGTSGVTRFHMQNTYRNGSIGRSIQWSFSLSDGVIGDDYDDNATAHVIYDEWVELKLVIDLDNDLLEQYYNGELFSSRAWVYSGTSQIQSIDLYGNGASPVYYDDIKIQDYLSSLVNAHGPSPEDGATDVSREVVLAWVAGNVAETHDVYLGTSFDDVNAASRTNPLDVLASQGQTVATFDPEGRLEFGQTFYWRVDEVDSDGTFYPGAVWSFTAEPFTYAVENITVSSNTTPADESVLESIVDGSGLDENDLHSVDADAMWLGDPDSDDPVYVQFDFGRVYKLYEVIVWNYNGEFEWMLGFGLQDVTVEYSADGVTWSVLGDVTLAQGASAAGYAANSTIDFGGLAVKAVRLTVNSIYGTNDRYGLSEVRFLYIPAQASKPQPAGAATDVDINTTLTWRSGREATSHEVYLDTDEAAVADSTALAGTADEASFDTGGLDFAQVYYWKVDEVNEAEAINVWEGDLWSFTTQQFATIDDFESYGDEDNLIYETWIDGWTNGSGSTVGYFEAPFAERTIVNGGQQSMPLEYNNAVAPYYSEAQRTWSLVQNWAAGGADVLTLAFCGAADNTAASLYVAIEDSAGQVAVVTYPDADAVVSEEWTQWQIPLGDLAGADLTKAETLYIGLGDRDNPSVGGAGLVYVDDIAFGRSAE